ncbi:hypothetical protein GC163_03695 [bacterium]|nr:hypothetical protein [bacterium]
MQRHWQYARQQCATFFFTQEAPFGVALMRIMLPLVMMSMVLPRWAVTRELYSADGATAPLALGYGYAHFLPEFSGEVAVALHTILLFAMICTCIGWMTRISLVISCVLYTYLNLLDAISTMTKYSVITTHLLLLLSCSNCGALWSVDAWLARRRGDTLNPLPPSFPAWPRRLVQLLIGVIYFGAAITKMNTPTFLSGDQLQIWMLTHINFRHPFGELLSLYPVLLKAMAYVTIVWEMTFVFLVWRGMWRPWVLAIGIVFHFLTSLTLGLFIFPVTCFTTYLSFIDEQDFLAIRHNIRLWARRQSWLPLGRWQAAWTSVWNRLGSPDQWRQPALVAFPLAMLVFTASGVGIEYWSDPYGVRRPEGRHQLKAVSSEFAQKLLAPTESIRDKDKFFAIDTGTLLVGDLLADRKRVFSHGDTMIIQCHLVPPHEDMWIECKILDAGNRLVGRTANVATREAFRLNFNYFVTTSLEPGNYTLQFESGGREVIRKQITIVGDGSSVAAN